MCALLTDFPPAPLQVLARVWSEALAVCVFLSIERKKKREGEEKVGSLDSKLIKESALMQLQLQLQLSMLPLSLHSNGTTQKQRQQTHTRGLTLATVAPLHTAQSWQN